MIEKLTKDIIKNGRRLSKKDDLTFFADCGLEELSFYSNEIRKFFRKNSVSFCTIINGKSGGCGEDCRFCAQSQKNTLGKKGYGFLPSEDILSDCKKRELDGIERYSIVTAGRRLSRGEVEKAAEVYRGLSKNCGIKFCASFGLLEYEDFVILKKSGLSRYHANIETSRNYFPNICTTHTFDDKVKCIKAAKTAGLEVCSGGIIGMGESFEDRIDMALELAELDVDSIPLNTLLPIKGTAFESLKSIEEDDIIKTLCVFRFVNPEKEIRIAAGRMLIKDGGKRGFLSGADGAISGDMLTTAGISLLNDLKMKKEVERILQTQEETV